VIRIIPHPHWCGREGRNPARELYVCCKALRHITPHERKTSVGKVISSETGQGIDAVSLQSGEEKFNA
jgi:hypothetical protein